MTSLASTPIGIFGGTFDPIHFGHLRPVAEIAQALQLARVDFVPAGAPPHRPPPQASAAQRLRMLELALESYPGFRIDTRELMRAGPSYTVDTLTSVRAECGAATPLCLLIGSDAFAQLETWSRWQSLPQLAHLIVMQRPDAAAALPAWAAPRVTTEVAALARAPAGHVWLHAVRPQPISATQIRRELARGPTAGTGVSDLMPNAVWQYIRENRLYQQP